MLGKCMMLVLIQTNMAAIKYPLRACIDLVDMLLGFPIQGATMFRRKESVKNIGSCNEPLGGHMNI